MANAASLPSAQASVTVARRNDSIVLVFAGVWTVGGVLPPLETVLAKLPSSGRPGAAAEPVLLDGAALGAWDSYMLVYLHGLAVELERRGFVLDLSAMPAGIARLLALASAVPPAGDARQRATSVSLAVRTGLAVQRMGAAIMAFIDFVGQVALATGRLLRGRAQFRSAELAVIMQGCGLQALPIVSLIAVLVGTIMAFVGAVQLRKFGAGIYVADLVAIATLREMGAVMTAVIMAGRTGAAFAAELATMQVNEEIDALETLGINPIEYLVLPRVLALALMMPLLCLYADVMGIIGGAIIGVTILGLPILEYWTQTQSALSLTHLTIGLVKAGVFGILIAVAGCLRGLSAGRSAAAVGVATTSAVVTAIVLIVSVDGIFAVILDLMGI